MSSTFDEMIELAVKLGMKIRHVHLGGSGGGMAVLRGEAQLFIDLDAGAADQLETVAVALALHEGLDNLFVRPDVRELIDRHRRA